MTEWVNHPTVVDAIKQQNALHAGLSKDEIVEMDKQWRAETASADRPLIHKVLTNSLSRYLANASKEQQGLVTEVFIMDNRGLNVGQSDVTSDYWQGDEAKWQKTFLVGPKAMIIDDVELDESTQTFQSQLSMSITDRATGEVIGAITVGVDVEAIVWATLDAKPRENEWFGDDRDAHRHRFRPDIRRSIGIERDARRCFQTRSVGI